MPELDPERLAIAEELQRQLASENELTPIQARAFVRGLQTGWDVPTIRWDQQESQDVFADAKRLIGAAVIFRSLQGTSSTQTKLCYRRAGELLEWLIRGRDDLSTAVPLELLAAACYQLGGIPAMSAALLKQAEQHNPGERLHASFLRADFDEVIRSVTDFWRNNLDITDRAAPRRILEEDGDDNIGWYITVSLVRTLGLLADSIRRGDTARFETAKRKLKAIDSLASRTMGDDVSMLVSLLLDVATTYGETSIYVPVRELAVLNPQRADRLERFARGQFSRGRGILWASQREGLTRLIKDESFALCTPTGSGKTLVANLAIVKELVLKANEDEGKLALYLVPSRALASEVEAKLSKELGDDVIVTGLYGGTDWGITDYWLDADKPTVLIATVEKADALMRFLGPLLLQRLCLLIVDEAHQVVAEDSERTRDDFAEHSSRSLRLEGFVSRLLSQAPDIARIALTAVAGGAASPVARWIEGKDEALAVGSNYRSTRQIIGSFQAQPESSGRLLLEVLNGKPLFVRGRDEPVYINLNTPPMPQLQAAWRNSVYRFNELDVLWTAMHLAAGGRRILISVAQQPEKTMGWYKEALAHEDWATVPEFGQPESDMDRQRLATARLACVDYCGENSFEVALLDRGIASNHGQMPQRIRRLMVDLIDRGICPVTVATATLTEGVNLPFDMIFLTALKRRSFNPTNNQQVENPMSTAEFRNLSGRAGRPGAGNGMEGITLVAIPRRPSSTANGTIPRQRGQIRQMKLDYRNLRQSLLAEELEQIHVESPLALLLAGIAERAQDLLDVNDENFLDWLEAAIVPEVSDEAGRAATDESSRLADSIDELDGVLLNAMEELQRIDEDGLVGAAAEAALSDIWHRTFTAYAAVQEDWMEAAFVRRGRAIFEHLYSEREERSRLYQYGFTPYVGRRFEEVVPAIRECLQQAAGYGSANDAERLAAVVAVGELLADDRGFGFRVRSTVTDRDILANWQGVLNWWLRGPDHDAPEPANLRSWQRFVSDNLEFRLGVSLGAVVARAWAEGVEGALVVPSLDLWRETTGLPWFAFWVRELLRWGTLDPFVAFALSQGLARTRDEGGELRTEFNIWLQQSQGELEAEDSIDPQRFLEWQHSREPHDEADIRRRIANVELGGTNGARGSYSVVPIVDDEVTHWIDPAGFSLAQSPSANLPFQRVPFRDDFELLTDAERPEVRRTYIAPKTVTLPT